MPTFEEKDGKVYRDGVEIDVTTYSDETTNDLIDPHTGEKIGFAFKQDNASMELNG